MERHDITYKTSAFDRQNSTGKEKDTETGYGYFGARYMDHELMTMWLSVDPMADKYPSISPYAYCAWNPVKLIDPDGEDIYPTMSAAEIDRNTAIRLFGAHRRNVVSGTLSLGAQISARYIDINLSSVNLIDLSYDIDYHNVNAQTIKEGYANGTTGFKVLFAGFKQNYVGGEYINFNSVTNIVSCGPVSVNLSNGDVEYGVSAAAIFGLSFKITSQIIKK